MIRTVVCVRACARVCPSPDAQESWALKIKDAYLGSPGHEITEVCLGGLHLVYR